MNWYALAFVAGCVFMLLFLMLIHACLPLECACGYRCFWSHSMMLHTEAKHFHTHRMREGK